MRSSGGRTRLISKLSQTLLVKCNSLLALLVVSPIWLLCRRLHRVVPTKNSVRREIGYEDVRKNEISAGFAWNVGTLPRIERSLVSRTKGWPPEIRPEKMVSIGSGGDSLVAMMQSADLRHLHDSALVRSLNRSAARSVLAQRQMRSRPLVVFEI
jgi:hypothetical protein